MASRFPSAPGIRTYVKRAFGDPTSLFFTYLALLVFTLFAGVEIKVFMDVLWPDLSPVNRSLAAAALIIGLGYLNLSGRELPRIMQVLIFASLIIGTVAISWVGLLQGTPPSETISSAPTAALASTIGIVFFTFIGFEWVTPIAKSPAASRRMIPLSMVVAILTLALTYLLFALALKSALPHAVLQESRVPHLLLGQHLFSLHGLLVMQCISAMALVTILNAGVIGASRFLYALGRDRSFFGWLNQRLIVLNGRGVSEASVILLCGLSMLSALLEIYLDDVRRIAELCAGLYCIVYSAFVASHIRLRAQAKARSPFHTALPVVFYYLLGAVLLALGIGTFIGSAEHVWARALLLVLICITTGYAAIAVSKSRRAAVTSPGQAHPS
jgi:ethanolamine permease